VLEPDYLTDGRGHLSECGIALGLGSAGGVADAMLQVITEQPDGDFLQCSGG